MSYLAYLNGFVLDLNDSKDIAITKQINDLANLDKRQSNFTPKFTIPFTATNVLAMKHAYFNGNDSNIAYQKNRFDLIDADSGKHLIFNGRANITNMNNSGYGISVYDGVIDFFKAIENKTLTEIGIPNLNHIKNVNNIFNSWVNDLDYKYIVADFNGKVLTDDFKLNADYLVPSAKKSYIFDRIHQYAGFTYEGLIFQTERFKNWWLTYPKPIPTTEPVLELLTSQQSEVYAFPSGSPTTISGGVTNFILIQSFFPISFTNQYINNVNTNNTGFEVTEAASFKVTMIGNFTPIQEVEYLHKDALNNIKASGFINPTNSESVIFNCAVGDRILFNKFYEGQQGSTVTIIERVVGFSANFNEALIDYKATDFIKEVLQHFGLTAFKDKYTNHIKYKTLSEVLQNTDVISDWVFSEKLAERSTISKYGKRNNYKYKYNDENVSYNDGFIKIENENLEDEVTILQSRVYSPEFQPNNILGVLSNVYKIWNKEPKDDGTVNYKELSGRFYYIRYIERPFSGILKSEFFQNELNYSSLPFESYYRLPLQQVIFDNYPAIESLLDKTKAIDASFYLTTLQVEKFNFEQLLYVKELGGYFLVNKINNFIKGEKTKLELIEVDYFKEFETPDVFDGTFITISSITVNGCDIEITFDTDATLPVLVRVTGNNGVPGGTFQDNVDITNLEQDNVINLTLNNGGFWNFVLFIGESFFSISSNVFGINIDSCGYIPPPVTLTTLTITDNQTLSINGNNRDVRVFYTSDYSGSSMQLKCYATKNGFPTITSTYFLAEPNGFVDVLNLPTFDVGGAQSVFQLQLQVDAVLSNIDLNYWNS
jgi:hypothetical protein